MNENISKPITLVKDEFSKNLVDLINSSNLPLFIVEYILKDVINEVHVAVANQAQADMANYTAKLEELKEWQEQHKKK